MLRATTIRNETMTRKWINNHTRKKKLETLKERWHNGCDEMWSFVTHMHFYGRVFCSVGNVVVAIFFGVSFEMLEQIWCKWDSKPIIREINKQNFIFSIAFNSSAYFVSTHKTLSTPHQQQKTNICFFFCSKIERNAEEFSKRKWNSVQMSCWKNYALKMLWVRR